MTYRIHSQSRLTGEHWTTVSFYGEVVVKTKEEADRRCKEFDRFFPYWRHFPVKASKKEAA